MTTITKRLDDLEQATGGAEVIGIWRDDSPALVRIVRPPAMASEMTPAEFEALPYKKTLIRVVHKPMSEIKGSSAA